MEMRIEPWLRHAMAGSCAIAMGLGVSRFDFSAVAHLMVVDSALPTAAIGQLSALNLTGYILGCVHHMALRRHNNRLRVLTVSVVGILLSMLLEWVSADFAIQTIGRILAGWSAGHLMSGVPSLAIASAPSHRRRQASAIVMSGAGMGALLGALAIGAFAGASESTGWLAELAISLVLACPVVWLLRCIPKDSLPQAVDAPSGSQPSHGGRSMGPIVTISLACLLAGAGQVPVVLYEPLVLSQRLGASAALSSSSLALLGSGCWTGAILAVCCPPRWPTRFLLPLIAAVGVLGTGLFWKANSFAAVASAVFVVGVWMWMFASLTFDRLGQLVEVNEQRKLWPLMTLLIALGFGLFSLWTAPLAHARLGELIVIGLIVMGLHLLMTLLQATSPNRQPKRA